MKRRNFIKTTGLSIAAVILADSLNAYPNIHSLEDTINYPDEVSAIVNNELVKGLEILYPKKAD